MQVYVPLPLSSESATTHISIERAPDVSGSPGSFAEVDRLPLLDDSGNFITSWRDGEEATELYWYHVKFLDTAAPATVWEGWLDHTKGHMTGLRMTGAGQNTQGVTETLITPIDVREYCRGLDLGNTADWQIQKFLKGVIANIEKVLDTSLGPRRRPQEQQTGTGHNLLVLHKAPLLEIHEIKVQFPFLSHTRTFQSNWLKVQNMKLGIVQVLTQQAINMFIRESGAMPHMPSYDMFPGHKVNLPQAIYADYTYGMSGTRTWPPIDVGMEPRVEEVELPEDIIELVAKRAAIETLQITGDAKGGGIASESKDGLSVSYTASATTHIYSARIESYKKDCDRILGHWVRPRFSFAH